jgi:hypothetical protein
VDELLRCQRSDQLHALRLAVTDLTETFGQEYAEGPRYLARLQHLEAAAGGVSEKTVDLGQGVATKLVRIPAGEFLIGDPDREADDRPSTRVPIRRDF